MYISDLTLYERLKIPSIKRVIGLDAVKYENRNTSHREGNPRIKVLTNQVKVEKQIQKVGRTTWSNTIINGKLLKGNSMCLIELPVERLPHKTK